MKNYKNLTAHELCDEDLDKVSGGTSASDHQKPPLICAECKKDLSLSNTREYVFHFNCNTNKASYMCNECFDKLKKKYKIN